MRRELLAGFYGTPYTDTAGTWFAKLRDCNCMDVSVEEIQYSEHNLCNGKLQAEVINSYDPHVYTWKTQNKEQSGSENSIDVNLCDYRYSLEISDKDGCTLTRQDSTISEIKANNNTVYPNPSTNQEVNIYFELPRKTRVSVYVFGSDGKLVSQILDEQTTESGKNLLNFSTSPLSSGVYIIRLMEGDEELLTEKLIIP